MNTTPEPGTGGAIGALIESGQLETVVITDEAFADSLATARRNAQTKP